MSEADELTIFFFLSQSNSNFLGSLSRSSRGTYPTRPFEGEGLTKKGFGRLAASVAIFIGTLGIYHLVVGSMQKWRVTHPGERGNVREVFQGVHGTQPLSPAEAFYARHPQVIRPSMWKD